jgi:hypothetical protein
MRVSHETIYKSLFVQTRGVLAKELTKHLRSGRPTRRNVHNTVSGQWRSQIKDAVSIRERPAEAADRAVPGHWEGDLLLGRGLSQVAAVGGRRVALPAAVWSGRPSLPTVQARCWPGATAAPSNSAHTASDFIPVIFSSPTRRLAGRTQGRGRLRGHEALGCRQHCPSLARSHHRAAQALDHQIRNLVVSASELGLLGQRRGQRSTLSYLRLPLRRTRPNQLYLSRTTLGFRPPPDYGSGGPL